MANSLASTLIGYGLQAAKVGDDTGIPGLDTSTALVRVVDRENRNFVMAPYQLNQPGWDFMIDEKGFVLQSATTTTSALVTTDVTIPVTETSIFQLNTSNGGAFVMYKENIPDTGIFGARSASSGAGNLTTASGISIAHDSGDSIYTLYPLPSNFGRPRAEKYKGDGCSINGLPLFYAGTGEPIGNKFSIFKDTTNSFDYLWVPRDASGNVFVRYDKAPTSISSAGTTVDVPVEYEEYIIQKVAAHVLRILSKEDSKIIDAEAQALNVLNMAFARRAIGKRASLTRGPIRSPGSIADNHYMTSSGDIY